MKTFSEYLSEVSQPNSFWIRGGKWEMGQDGYWTWDGPMHLLDDQIDDLPDDKIIGALYHHSLSIADIENPSRTVLDWLLHNRVGFLATVRDVRKLPADYVKQVLVSEDFMLNWHTELYDTFVKDYFKNNTVMMNKWLRYAQNIRSLPVGKGY
jgi:hypothetical protein